MTPGSIFAKKVLAERTIAILSYLILLGGIITIGFSAYLVVVSYSPLPYWDGWIQINSATEGGNPIHPRLAVEPAQRTPAADSAIVLAG